MQVVIGVVLLLILWSLPKPRTKGWSVVMLTAVLSTISLYMNGLFQLLNWTDWSFWIAVAFVWMLGTYRILRFGKPTPS